MGRKSGAKKKSGSGADADTLPQQGGQTADVATDNAGLTAMPSLAEKQENATTGEDKRDSGISPPVGYMTPMNQTMSPTNWSAEQSPFPQSEQAPVTASQAPKKNDTAMRAMEPNESASVPGQNDRSKASTQAQHQTQREAKPEAKPEAKHVSSAWGKGRECRPLRDNPLAGIPRPADGQSLPIVKQRALDQQQQARSKAMSLLEESALRDGTSHEDATNYGKQVLAQPEPQPKKRPEPVKSATTSGVTEQPQPSLAARPRPRPQSGFVPGQEKGRTEGTQTATAQPRPYSSTQPQPQQYNQPQKTQVNTNEPPKHPAAEKFGDQRPQGLEKPIAAVGEPSSAPDGPQQEKTSRTEHSRLVELVRGARQAASREQQLTQQAEEELYAREAITSEARAVEEEVRQLGSQELEALEEVSKEAARKESEARQEIHEMVDLLREEAEQAAKRSAEYDQHSAELIDQYFQATREANTNAMLGREKLEEEIRAKEATTKSALQAEKEMRETYRHARELADAAAKNEQIARANLKNKTGSADIDEPSGPDNGGVGGGTIANQNRTVPSVSQKETSATTGYPVTQPIESTQPALAPQGGFGESEQGAAGTQPDDAATQEGVSRPTVPERKDSMSESVKKDAKKKRHRFSNLFHRSKKDKDPTESATSGQESNDGNSVLEPAEGKLRGATKKAALKNAAKHPSMAMKGAKLTG